MWDFFVRVVCERECEDSRQSEKQEVSRGAFLQSEAHAEYMTGMRRVMTAGFCEYFAGNAFPRDTPETFCFSILAYLLHRVFT